MATTARNTGCLAVDQARSSKMHGVSKMKGLFRRVGKGGLMAIQARQHEEAFGLTPEIQQCFEVIEVYTASETFSTFFHDIFLWLETPCRF